MQIFAERATREKPPKRYKVSVAGYKPFFVQPEGDEKIEDVFVELFEGLEGLEPKERVEKKKRRRAKSTGEQAPT